MRRIVFSVLLASAALAAGTPTAAQAAGFEGSRTPDFGVNTPYPFNGICYPPGATPVPPFSKTNPAPAGSFGVHVTPTADNQYSMQLPDGTQLTTGHLVLSFQKEVIDPTTGHPPVDSNGNPIIETYGPAIVQDESGPTWSTVDPNTGTGMLRGTGLNAELFGPRSQHNLNYTEPGLVFLTGPFVLSVENRAVTTFSLSGTQVNGCALLAS